ncbi:MAG: 50S ribosomal protein L29 [Acidobacteriota bacterium]
MTIKKVRELQGAELAQKVDELQNQIFKLRIQRAIGQEGNPVKVRTLRREIARLKTVQTEQSRQK